MSSSSPKPRILLIGFGPTTRSALDSLLRHFDVIALVREARTRCQQTPDAPVFPWRC